MFRPYLFAAPLYTLLLALPSPSFAVENPSCPSRLEKSDRDKDIDHIKEIQLNKNRTRTLGEHEGYLFSGIKKMEGSTENFPIGKTQLPKYLKALIQKKKGHIRWTDVGAGYALPLTELKRDYAVLADQFDLTAVDLFDWDQLADTTEEQRAQKDAGQDILHPAFKPKFILGDMSSATPPPQSNIDHFC